MIRKTYYLGFSVTYHDPALAVLDGGGRVLFAEATERHCQRKRALNAEPDDLAYFPEVLRAYCGDAEEFVLAFNWARRRPLYENLMAAFGVLHASGLLRTGIKRLKSPLENYQLHHMMACQRRSIDRAGLNAVRMIHQDFPRARVHMAHFDHHATHAASACYASPFDSALCAVVDSYGQHGGLAFYRFDDGRLRPLHVARGLGSLGLFYMKLTESCGFDWLKGEEWKVMGLAAYGGEDAEFLPLLRAAIRVDGLNLVHDRAPLDQALSALDRLRRNPAELERRAADLAYSGQQVFGEKMTELLEALHALGGADNLCLAGGCALNSSFNGQILERTPFRALFVPPAPADDGTALGAAYLACAAERPVQRESGAVFSPYLGAAISADDVARIERSVGGLRASRYGDGIEDQTARRLASGKLVGWVQGRAEFGPRALGNRSILADPRDPGMKDRINQRVKFREEYRPFAPAVLAERGQEFFENYQPSPYMERTLRFLPEAAGRVPAVVHVDGTGRLQTVGREVNPRFHRLISAFDRLTGVPVLLNTSFNVMGKPIVHSVEDAIAVLMSSGLDVLVLDDLLIEKP